MLAISKWNKALLIEVKKYHSLFDDVLHIRCIKLTLFYTDVK